MVYNLIRKLINDQRKDEEGKRVFATFFVRFDIWNAPSHIKENIHVIYNEMIDAGYMELTEEDKEHGLHKFKITETGYIEVNGLGKKREEITMTTGHTIIAGDGAKINVDSIDNSTTTNLTINNNQLEIFERLLELATSLENNKEIVESIEGMKIATIAKDKKTFRERYDNFMASAANHATIFWPLLSELGKLL